MQGQKLPEQNVSYQSFVVDNSRWQGFNMRAGDIIISTPPKAGTTWTQMICALLVFQKTDLGKGLSEFTPWVDAKTIPIEEVLATYEAQTHRRFIKTHTPLDGLPYSSKANYVVVGRDPRDAFLSMDNHRQNTSPEWLALIAKNAANKKAAAGNAASAKKQTTKKPAAKPADIGQQFETWITAEGPMEEGFDPQKSSLLHHLQSFWAYRHLPNIIFLHYADMKQDLAGEMQRLADFLQIEVPDGLMPELVQAASFASMKQQADIMAPNAHKGIWKENSRFFNKGEIGQWRDVFQPAQIDHYRKVMDKLDPEFVQWVENGTLS
ncbi:MAG: sulfotransferase domain-containing protein [Pseudomonadales bacterium]|nr:sulfotransferase domain-containing protein [Pseudomonadales bacterium]